MRRLLLLLLVVASAFQVWAYKQQSIDITVNGQKRNMVVFTPDVLPANSPLFIVTHGMNQSPEYQYPRDKMYEMIDTAKFVITYLRSNGNTWNLGAGADRDFVLKTIDEMATKFDINRDRVYWTGFSMGSMLIHSCIGSMQNKIAAFAPTSGIQHNGAQPWTSCSKPVNLLEVIAYGDDVFPYYGEGFMIHDYIENYAKHDKHTMYSKTSNYKPVSNSEFDGDLEKWTGGPNGGEVWLYSYNNGWHDPRWCYRTLIWNFCKRFTLNQPTVGISSPAGESTYVCIAPTGGAVFPDVEVKANVKATNGSIVKVDFYRGKTLIDSVKAAPYTMMVPPPATTGKSTMRVVATDSNGKRGEASSVVNFATSQTTYSLTQTFKTEGTVPQGWYVSNGSTKRAGSIFPLTSGCRLLKFTASTRAFAYGILVQNATTKAKNAWAKFGDKSGRSCLTLTAGSYALKYKVCNWNCPEFSPVTVAIETPTGEEVASQTYTPTVNIGNNVGNKFSGVAQQTFTFDIPETGDYVIAFYADAARNADFVLGLGASLQAVKFFATGIDDIDNRPNSDARSKKNGCYDLSGRRLSKENLKPGIYIIDGRKVFVEGQR